MIYKKNIMKFTSLFIILILLIIVSTYVYIKNEEKILLNAKYKSVQTNTEKSVHHLIEDKMNATLGLSIFLSKDSTLINNIKNGTYEKLNYQNLSLEVKKNTNFKNVWIQIIDKNGFSRYRSWTTKTDVDLNVREDVKELLITQKTISSLSVGRITMSFKAMCPIFDENNNFLGIIETITHFNSIVKKLKEMNIDSIVIADKKYKHRLTNPYTKQFVKDYYITNLLANKELVTLLENSDIENLLNSSKYILTKEDLITVYTIKSKYDDELGYVISRLKLKNIDIHTIKTFKMQTVILVSIFLLSISFLFVFYIYNVHSKNIDRLNNRLKKHIEQLKIQERKKQLILDSQSNIIVITDGEHIISANKQLLNFFKDVDNLNEFKQKYKCICSAFVDVNDTSYLLETDYNGNNWAEHVLANPKKNFKAAIFNHKKELRHFSVSVTQEINLGYILVTLSDITLEIEQKIRLKFLNNNLEKLVKEKTKELQELNESLEIKIRKEVEKSKKKDTLLFQQTKMTAIAETLKNIAHQWRQPLSVISTATSGMQIQREMNILSDKDFSNNCKVILDNTKYLSKTIDNFTNFFIEEKSKTKFSLINSINSSIKFLNSTFEEKNIKVEFIYDKDITLYGYKNEFQQAIVSILDNSIFAIEQTQDSKNRYIVIEINNNILNIKDNGNGIENKNLNRVFEPYFTTKHQAFGIGIGLYMVQEVLIKHMNLKINISNITFEYNKSSYKGVNFTIDFN